MYDNIDQIDRKEWNSSKLKQNIERQKVRLLFVMNNDHALTRNLSRKEI